jgi:hypothetical protein
VGFFESISGGSSLAKKNSNDKISAKIGIYSDIEQKLNLKQQASRVNNTRTG